MLWIVLAVLSGLIFGALGVIGKHLMEDASSLLYTSIYSLLVILLYLPFFLYFLATTSFQLTLITLAAAAVSGLANITGYLSYNQAIKAGELSEEIPLAKLNPLFTAILGVAVLGETLSPINVAGIFAVVAGTFIVLVNPLKFFQSLKEKETLKPAGIAVLSAMIFSIAAVADRYATQQMPPKIYMMLIFLIMISGYIPLLYRKYSSPIEKINNHFRRHVPIYLLTGVLAILGSLSIFTAFSMAPASKVIPLLQLQVLVSIVAGGKIFDEEDIPRKILGSVILILGVLLVTV